MNDWMGAVVRHIMHQWDDDDLEKAFTESLQLNHDAHAILCELFQPSNKPRPGGLAAAMDWLTRYDVFTNAAKPPSVSQGAPSQGTEEVP